MILLDENIIASQCALLRGWRIHFRQIGPDAGRKGMLDEEIPSLLHGLGRVTFFTRDIGFHKRSLCHRRYCVAAMAVAKEEVAAFARRFLRHPAFRTQERRLGKIVLVSQTGVRYWQLGMRPEQFVSW